LFPFLRPFLPARRGLVQRLRPDPEGGSKWAAGTTQHFSPEIGNRLPCATHGGAAASLREDCRRDPQFAADGGNEAVKGEAWGARLGRWFHLPLESLHEGRTPQDPFVTQIVLPATPEFGHNRPTPQAADETASLELGAPTSRDAGGGEFAVGSLGATQAAMELGKHYAGGLPGPSVAAEERGVASPGITVEFGEGLDHTSPEGIQVQVADKLEEVSLFLYSH
jgi:hypothetical protein